MYVDYMPKSMKYVNIAEIRNEYINIYKTNHSSTHGSHSTIVYVYIPHKYQ